MCYYTITSDEHDKEGRTQALMIIDTQDEGAAEVEFISTFKLYKYKVVKGIHIDSEFSDLLTPSAKKLIMKHKSGNTEGKMVSYCNSLHTKYEE